MAIIPYAEYETPQGYYDLPYIHVYDGDALTDGVNYSNINVGVSDNEAGFVLRQVMGMQNLAARIQLRDSFAPLTTANTGFVMPRTYPVAPERFISPAGILSMDLFNVLRAMRTDLMVIIYLSQIAFQGLKRYLQPQGIGKVVYPGASDYKYVEKPFVYQTNVAVTWPGTDPSPRKFSLPIVEGCDFELQRIAIVRTQLAGVANYGIPDREIKLQLFDQYGKQLSNRPVLDIYLNDAADAVNHLYNGTFPVPAVLYRRQSFIRFEVTSLLLAGPAPVSFPAAYDIYFQGVRRVPIR